MPGSTTIKNIAVTGGEIETLAQNTQKTTNVSFRRRKLYLHFALVIMAMMRKIVELFMTNSLAWVAR